MDKRSLLGFVLIAIVITVFMIYNSMNQKPPEPKKQAKQDTIEVKDTLEEEVAADTVVEEGPSDQELLAKVVGDSFAADTSFANSIDLDSLRKVKNIEDEFGSYFSKFALMDDDTITVENDLFIAKFRAKGASLIFWELKNYTKWDGVPARLVKPEHEGEMFMTFKSRDNKDIDARGLTFTFDNPEKKNYKISADESVTLTAKIDMGDGKSIVRKLTFYGNEYAYDDDISFVNMESFLKLTGFELQWKDGLKYQEKRSDLESNEGLAMVSMNGEIEELDATERQPVRLDSKISGVIDYAAIKSKYFGMAVMPQKEQNFEVAVDFEGITKPAPNNGHFENYDMYMHVQYKGGEQSNKFKVYIGPLEYDEVDKYGLGGMINFGFWLLRPIGEYVLMPFFNMIHMFIPNYGITIIFFSIFIKILLYPLSVPQMRSSQKMKLIQPELNKVREKYKDDQKKQQQETMKIYSKYGINPAGGCLPLILQMPILIALWKVFNTTIELRQADFALWISDLSLPDYVIPFPILGITHLSGLALLMGATMFIQQKMTLTDPRQKAMVYMMPIMFTFMFSNLPSGLNLYYFMFTLIGIVQQIYINKFSRKKVTLEVLKKSPKKESWLQKKMREAQEIAESQGRAVPGKQYQSSKSKNQRKRKK